MINVSAYNNKNEICGTKDEIEMEVSALIECLIRSGMLEDYEIIGAVSIGFYACGKEKEFLKYSTLLNGFDFSKLKRIGSVNELRTYVMGDEDDTNSDN